MSFGDLLSTADTLLICLSLSTFPPDCLFLDLHPQLGLGLNHQLPAPGFCFLAHHRTLEHGLPAGLHTDGRGCTPVTFQLHTLSFSMYILDICTYYNNRQNKLGFLPTQENTCRHVLQFLDQFVDLFFDITLYMLVMESLTHWQLLIIHFYIHKKTHFICSALTFWINLLTSLSTSSTF